MFGARDGNKDPVLNAQMMRDAFAEGGNKAATVVVFDNANHGIFETLTGLPLESELPKLKRLAPGYLESLATFLAGIGQ